MKKQKYFIGLDIGTDSVGFAVTDTTYNVIKKGKKDLWGVRLFDDAQTAVERRVARASRRRLARQKERIELLRQLFDEEISKIDKDFFLRLEESMYHYDDKTIVQYNSLFNDTKFTDKEFAEKYKTIYHLRLALINGEVTDPRMLYLGLAHIVKNRGNFLFEGLEFSDIDNFEIALKSLNEVLETAYDNVRIETNKIKDIEEIFKNKKMTTSVKEREIIKKISNNKDITVKSIVKLMTGGTVTVSKLFDVSDEDFAKKSICFKKGFEELYPELESGLEGNIIIINACKAVYDWSVLSEILKGEHYLSNAKINSYEEHRNDLEVLKRLVKKYIKDDYIEIFKSEKETINYPTYIGMTIKSGKKVPLENKKCSQEDLCKYLKKKLDKIDIIEDEFKKVIEKIEIGTILPKLRLKENAVIPMQVHKAELLTILNNSKFEFLQNTDGKYTIAEKIELIFNYRIPYYVGPLNANSSFSWIERKEGIKITPWNFDEVVNKALSAENFIRRMTNKCTYIKEADVLPKSSILYSKFTVLNELNNLKINGEGISVKLKQDIFNDLFLMQNKVTRKNIEKYLKSKVGENLEITGIDVDFKSNMKPYLDFKGIFSEVNLKMAEDIIKWVTLFSEDKKILSEKIKENYNIDESKLKRVLNLKYSGFGKLSRELLEDVHSANSQTGEAISIITAMYETNLNLMQLLSKDYGYKDVIDTMNISDEKTDVTYEDVEKLYCSPSVKKSIWQSVKIVKELEKVMGSKPEKLFIETTRQDGEAGKRTQSRHKALMELYKSIKKENPEIYTRLENSTENDLRIKKVYLYYTQLGKCAYTGRSIDFNDLMSSNLYDIEHIYPRSKTKDDSIHNNLVLVYKEANLEKTNEYPIPQKYRQNELWKCLADKGLINKEKYSRLTRTTDFVDRELEGFIARQLVETSQATKAVAEIFKEHYKGTSSKVCYVKANHVSDFRKEFDLIKCRDVNDYHHAKDAYLNIVVGNVFNTKFTENFFKKSNWRDKYTLNTREIYKWDTYKKSGEDTYYAWKAGDNSTIKTVKSVMMSNNILFTRKAYKQSGVLFDLTVYKKGHGEFAVKNPRSEEKQYSKLMNLEKYGGFKSLKGSYFCVVEHTSKNKTVRTIEYIPIYLASEIKQDETLLLTYLKENLGLQEPKIILKELKINALLNVDGMPMHLSSRMGERIVFKGAVQLNVNYQTEKYMKALSTFVSKLKANPNLKISNNKKSKNVVQITKEENIKLYDLLVGKLIYSIYAKRLSNVGEKIRNKREKFEGLSLENQSKALYNIINLFACNISLTDISIIGESKGTGRIDISKNITSLRKLELINQSITGIYENKINLLK